MDGDTRWRAARQHLERFCPPARLSKFHAALVKLERGGADPVVIARTLERFWGLDYKHRISQQRKNKGIVFAKHRRQAHRNLLGAVGEALRLYEEFRGDGGEPIPMPIEALCRQLRARLTMRYQDAAASGGRADVFPDLLYADGAIWHEKQLRKARRGARKKEHKAPAEAALKAAGATTRQIAALLVSSIVR